MKRILSEVSVSEMRGPLNKLMELLENEKTGHYWLHQLSLMMRKEPTHTLTSKWLDDLSSRFTWEKAEKYFRETRQLWFHEPNWPFQICVLEIGSMSNYTLLKKWSRVYRSYSEEELASHIISISQGEKKKIFLLRIQARYLGFKKEFNFGEMNRDHSKFNLSLCPTETAFYLRFKVKEYDPNDSPTIMAMDFHPPDMVDKKKNRSYWFAHDKGYGKDIKMGDWDISDIAWKDENSWWIFQYDLSY